MTLETMWRRYRSLLDSELSFSNYRERFALLLSCEEHQMQLDIRNYDMEVSYSLLLLGQVGFQNKNFDVVVTESIFCYQNIFSFELGLSLFLDRLNLAQLFLREQSAGPHDPPVARRSRARNHHDDPETSWCALLSARQ